MKKKSSMQMKKRMSPAKINKGLEKAAASGKLDKNPKFKAVVEKAAKKRKDDTPAMLKKSMAQLKKSMAQLMKDDKVAMKLKKDGAMMMKKASATMMKNKKSMATMKKKSAMMMKSMAKMGHKKK